MTKQEDTFPWVCTHIPFVTFQNELDASVKKLLNQFLEHSHLSKIWPKMIHTLNES